MIAFRAAEFQLPDVLSEVHLLIFVYSVIILNFRNCDDIITLIRTDELKENR